MDLETLAAEAEPPIPDQVVFIDNLSEDVWPFIEALDDEKVKRTEISENAALTDRQYLGVRAEYPENLTFVAPEVIDPAFIDYVDSVVDGAKPHLLVPENHTGQISNDVLSDTRIINTLTKIKQINLISYCSSLSWYGLLNQLKLNRPMGSITTTEAPMQQDWERTVATYGTKGGLRQELSQAKGILEGILPNGTIVFGKDQIVEKVWEMTRSGNGVVIKTNKGHSGMGVVIIKPEEVVETKSEFADYIHSRLEESNGYWNKFPTVVEEYIQTDKNVGGGFPNIECRIDEKGTVEVLYLCGMRVARGGVFAGVEIVENELPEELKEKIINIGLALGNLYAKKGYRGYFDVDFMADISGKLYISESNVRRTGGTFAIQVAKRLFGKEGLKDRYFVTNLITLSGLVGKTFEEVRQILKPVLFDRRSQNKTGVILASANLVPLGKLNYMVVANNKNLAAKLELNILSLLEGK